MPVIALPTGRSFDSCVEIIQGAGLPVGRLKDAGRNLVIDEGEYRFLMGKPSDIPTLVSQGVADLALVGSDVTEESDADLTELLDTGRGRCYMAVAGPEELARRFSGHASSLMGLRVGTKYQRTARRTFAAWGVQIRTLYLNGSVELAPALGLADCIFDIVQTGGTLRANGLAVIKRTAEVSLRLVAGFGALQLRWGSLRSVVEAVEDFVSSGGENGENAD
ncbi:MAG: ATP phosphoribosyltransferase [Synergistaceae bacterium]|jgi:ATP phosphoribosyltransferase|nr:ATP phosphoribosyltransferase [Synergistaceae bacterium]